MPLVAAVDALRLAPGGRRASLPVDDLDDPWGGPDDEFARTADGSPLDGAMALGRSNAPEPYGGLVYTWGRQVAA